MRIGSVTLLMAELARDARTSLISSAERIDEQSVIKDKRRDLKKGYR